MSKETYKRRKTQGICVKCGKKKAVKGKVQCFECAEHQKEENRKNRKFYMEHGICYRCGKNKLFGDEKICPECLAENMIACKKWQSKQGGSSEYYKKKIKILKEKGLCRKCNKRKVEVGKTYCTSCLIKHREESRIYRYKKSKNGIPRNERFNYGLCYICGNKLDTDKKVCESCLKTLSNNLPKTSDNKLWREDNKIIFSK